MSISEFEIIKALGKIIQKNEVKRVFDEDDVNSVFDKWSPEDIVDQLRIYAGQNDDPVESVEVEIPCRISDKYDLIIRMCKTAGNNFIIITKKLEVYSVYDHRVNVKSHDSYVPITTYADDQWHFWEYFKCIKKFFENGNKIHYELTESGREYCYYTSDFDRHYTEQGRLFFL